MIDRLMEKILARKNPTVVGLDPTLAMIPMAIRVEAMDLFGKTPEAAGHMLLRFNKALIDEIGDLIPAVKPQIAMYEMYGVPGIKAYLDTIRYARERGLLVIGDIKRGDIASTAAAYAAHINGVEIEGTFTEVWQEDAITLNPYMGYDGIAPFIKVCTQKDRGLFILVKTSNPSSTELQDLMVDEQPVFMHTAKLVSDWGLEAMGQGRYSRVGAVVGATFSEQAAALRKAMPHTFFLVPGYGAQGGRAEDLKGLVDQDGLGIIVNSSRGIIAAHMKQDGSGIRDGFDERNFAAAARQAVLAMRRDLADAVGADHA